MTLQDRLSRLSYLAAVKLLGPRGRAFITAGGRYTIDIPSQVAFSTNVFRLDLGDSLVSIIHDEKSVSKMRFLCSSCEGMCEHIGAALSLVLEEKTALGLAVPPPDDCDPLDLSDEELVHREMQRRIDRARTERFRLTRTDTRRMWSDYLVYSAESGKTYRVALRGWENGESYCTCPDFRKNTLGTCKHIMYVAGRVRKIFPDWRRASPCEPRRIAVYLRYGMNIELRMLVPGKTAPSIRRMLDPYIDKPITDIAALMQCISACTAMGEDIHVYPDAEQYISLHMHRRKLGDMVAAIRKNPASHPLRTSLLKSELLPSLAAETGRKVIVFSEWTTMLDLIEKQVLNPRKLAYVRLDGSVPQKMRPALVHRFQSDPACTFFAATNAGATGLNLQAANTIVNVDLPWNPAVLEQRIGRAHRMGQKRPVHVYLMVTEDTIEENMLRTLSAKHDLSRAALDIESDVTRIDLETGIDELKRRLELLLGEKPEAQPDRSMQAQVETGAETPDRRREIEEAGGRLFAAALSFIGTMIPADKGRNGRGVESAARIRDNLAACMQKEDDGGVSLKLRLPDAAALDVFAETIAAIAGTVSAGKG